MDTALSMAATTYHKTTHRAHKMTQNLVYKTAEPWNLKSLSTDGVFKGFASTPHKDSHNDIVRNGAFRHTLNTWRKTGRWPHLLWQHQMDKPIGEFSDMEERSDGLLVTGRLLLSIQKGQEAYELLKRGIIKGLSIGFQPTLARYNPAQKAREIFQVRLVEVSLVTAPANPMAQVHSVKTLFN